MTELRNVEADLSRFRMRVLVASIVVLVAFLLLASRLVYLQVVRHDDLSEQAENNRTAIVPVVPNRGPDPGPQRHRAGHQLLGLHAGDHALPAARPAWTQTIDELAQVIEIQPRDRRRFKKLLEESKSFESLPIRTKLTDEEVARFAAQRYRFPGVDIKARLFRNYPWGELASHVIGYIGRINQAEKKADGGLARGRAGQLPRHRIHRQAGRRAGLREAAARHHRASSRWRLRPAGARCASSPAARPRRATR